MTDAHCRCLWGGGSFALRGGSAPAALAPNSPQPGKIHSGPASPNPHFEPESKTGVHPTDSERQKNRFNFFGGFGGRMAGFAVPDFDFGGASDLDFSLSGVHPADMRALIVEK